MRKVIVLPVWHHTSEIFREGEAPDLSTLRWRKHDSILTDYLMSSYVKGLQHEEIDRVYWDSYDGSTMGGLSIDYLLENGSTTMNLILELEEHGAVFEQTEDPKMAQEARDLVKSWEQIGQNVRGLGDIVRAILPALRAKREFMKMIDTRDEYAAERINESLEEGETGLLIMGYLHNVHEMLPDIAPDIEIVTLPQTPVYLQRYADHVDDYLNSYGKRVDKDIAKYLKE